MAVRVALVILSLLVLGWVGVLTRDRHVGRAALTEVRRKPELPPARFAREMRRLRDAELLNPDSTWELYRGSSWFGHGDRREAIRILSSLARREPDNLQVWGALYLAARRIDPRLERRAVAETKRLTPLGSP